MLRPAIPYGYDLTRPVASLLPRQDEMPDQVERKGIGTSATRAATIEKLVRIGFVERKGNKKTNPYG